MRRLLRWTFHALAAVSLLLCLAMAGLWVRSYWMYDRLAGKRPEFDAYTFEHRPPYYDCSAISRRGHFKGWVSWSGRPEVQPSQSWEFWINHPTGPYSDERTDFEFRTAHQFYGGYTGTTLYWAVPAWALVSAFAVLPAVAVFRQVRAVRRRRHRARLGCCPACGYDLRGTPERCPECGALSAVN